VFLTFSFVLSTPFKAQSSHLFFVKPGASGSGSSWANASGDLSTILKKAHSDDVIWVAAGKYLPSQRGDRKASFVIPEGVKIYGGFAGHETRLSARSLSKNPTILSGTKTVAPNICGGGIFLEAASPTIRNCVLSDNSALHGGGMYAYAPKNRSAPKLENCVFNNNRAELYGGGLCNDGEQGVCAPTLYNCRILKNQALYGAGIANQGRGGSCIVLLRDCQFQENFADLRGGAILNRPTNSEKGKVVFEACSFRGNMSTIGRDTDERPYKSGSGTLVF